MKKPLVGFGPPDTLKPIPENVFQATMKTLLLIFSFFTLFSAGVALQAAPGNVSYGPIVAHYVQMVSAEFVVDIYHNGVLVPQSQRQLQKEIYGAQIEKVSLELHEGDWIVFHVVNNGLRTGFPRCFFAAGMLDETHPTFVTEAASHRWLACDNIQKVSQFIAKSTDRGDTVWCRPFDKNSRNRHEDKRDEPWEDDDRERCSRPCGREVTEPFRGPSL